MIAAQGERLYSDVEMGIEPATDDLSDLQRAYDENGGYARSATPPNVTFEEFVTAFATFRAPRFGAPAIDWTRIEQEDLDDFRATYARINGEYRTLVARLFHEWRMPTDAEASRLQSLEDEFDARLALLERSAAAKSLH